MIRLPDTLAALGSTDAREIIKREIERIDPAALPLQQGLARSSHVTERPFQAVILGVHEVPERVRVKAGIFYSGIIAGCSCADDPTPVDEITEYCVVEFAVDRASAGATVTLLDE
jgi:hypothetical protein